jgi:hypothetical protein
MTATLERQTAFVELSAPTPVKPIARENVTALRGHDPRAITPLPPIFPVFDSTPFRDLRTTLATVIRDLQERLDQNTSPWLTRTFQALTRFDDAADRVLEPRRVSRGQYALGALADLKLWLALDTEATAHLGGFTDRATRNWPAREPHASTVRRLNEVHSLLFALVKRIGVPGARAWLRDETDGASRLDLLFSDDGLSRVLREARPLLFPRARSLAGPWSYEGVSELDLEMEPNAFDE